MSEGYGLPVFIVGIVFLTSGDAGFGFAAMILGILLTIGERSI
jgi:hypothetical protein